jgi:ribonucleoside-diphosphate reductase alpha chain
MAGGTPMAQPKTVGANALKSELEQGLGITPQAQTLGSVESLAFEAPVAKPAKALDKRAEARMKGYVGESCPECANFTLVRNGTCLKCDTCGSTTGCS